VEIEARQLASELRDGFLLLTSLFFIGLSKANLGQMSDGIATLEEAIKIAGRNGDRFWFPRMPNCIGWMHRELEDHQGAFKYDQEGLQVARQFHVLEAEANSLINLGIDHTIEGKHQETANAFNETREIFERDAWFRWRYNIRLEAATAWHWLRKGDLDKASEYAQRLLDTATEFECHKYQAEAHRIKAHIAGQLDQVELAVAEFQAALQVLEHYPVPVLKWRILGDVGRLEQNRGNHAVAEKALADALDIVSFCAANVKDEKLRTNFLNSNAVRALRPETHASPPA
ncbi:MAG TPA: hypothetical protein VLB68_28585, partial [Pyrinomonadaceae bacterium]|nr:hypothetical protein [Pyrinomonadaceae bacterium]